MVGDMMSIYTCSFGIVRNETDAVVSAIYLVYNSLQLEVQCSAECCILKAHQQPVVLLSGIGLLM